ncbi:hypothetical protein SKAU_G00316300 [Synaphobranchus kaupii]|uniref:Heat shock factor-binding protein 1 n=1 Tax=Synaphobranchus kaupii TaxID=118154 RepID=A0A9Q1ESN1_SYNKA|nr:hypothetical protein SKAU_G00316300 [Synaphobranchus kaupii]
MAETDPKSVQDLTAVVQTLLQQMQDKFQTMSDQIIGRNILPPAGLVCGRGGDRGREQGHGGSRGITPNCAETGCQVRKSLHEVSECANITTATQHKTTVVFLATGWDLHKWNKVDVLLSKRYLYKPWTRTPMKR